jgi:hypothetical protein
MLCTGLRAVRSSEVHGSRVVHRLSVRESLEFELPNHAAERERLKRRRWGICRRRR